MASTLSLTAADKNDSDKTAARPPPTLVLGQLLARHQCQGCWSHLVVVPRGCGGVTTDANCAGHLLAGEELLACRGS